MNRAFCTLGVAWLVPACASATRLSEFPAAPPRTEEPAQASGTAEDAEELAKKLSNPVAELTSVPFQLNYDKDIGPGDDGERWQLNIQPVVPITLNEEWNLISRTIFLIITQDDVAGDDDTGFGDTTQSFFLSPKQPTEGGLIWGVGPAFLIPTATDNSLGNDKWGVGPTAVLLKQAHAWTYGVLANHIWSFAGDDDGAAVSSTFVQPFLAHTTPAAWTYTLNAESTYDWRGEDFALPVNAIVSKVHHFGELPVSLGAGARYWLERADGGPEGFGLRFIVTFLLPK
jgi:hypothetical protein